MSLLDDIKAESEGRQVKVQTEEEKALEAKLNKLFYLDKKIEEETSFIKHVMTRGQETSERKGLHASAIIKPDEDYCIRQQVLSLFYKQSQGEDTPVGLKRIFSEGDAIHEKWQRLFIRGGYAEPCNCDKTRFSTYYDLQFTPDIECTIDGVSYIVEIKSMNTHAYQRMIKSGGEHVSGKLQLYLYMHLTGVTRGFTLCEDKNTQDFTVKLYRYEESAIRKYIERLEAIQAAKFMLKKRKKIMPRKKDCISYECECAKKCCMRDACWKKDKTKI